MPRLLSPEEFDAEFGGGYAAAPTERAGYGTRLGAAVDSMQAGLYGLGEAAGLDLGDRRRQNQYESEQNYRRYYRDTGAPQSFRDIQGVGDAATWLGGLAVDTTPYLAGLAAGGLVGGPAGAFAVGTTFGTGDVLQNQREEAGYTNLGTALPLGAAYGAVDALTGVGGMVARRSLGTGLRALDRTGTRYLDDMQGFAGGAARAAAQGGKQFLVEGAGETFQEGVNQLGRISVNPDQTFFNPEANDRYLESFVAGGALGGVAGAGLRGWRRSDEYTPPTVDEGPFDLTQRAAPAPQYSLTTRPDPLQARIDQALGVSRERTPKDYAKIFEAAASEGSGVRVTDANGIERELSMGEYLDMQAGETPVTAATAATTAEAATDAPASKVFSAEEKTLIDAGIVPQGKRVIDQLALLQATQDLTEGVATQVVGALKGSKLAWAQKLADFGQEIKAAQLPEDDLSQVYTLLADNRLADAKKALAKTIIESRAAATATPAPEGVVNGAQAAQAVQAEAQGSQPAPVQPAVPAGQPVAGPAGTVEAAGVVEPEAVSWDEYRDDTQAGWTELPDNQKQIWRDALSVRDRGQPINLYKVAEQLGGVSTDARLDMLKKVFGDRDGEIVFDVVGNGMGEADAAKKWGMSRANIQKIAGATGRKTWPAKIKAAVEQYGFTEDQVASAFSSTTNEADLARSEVESEVMPTTNMFNAGTVDPLLAKEAGMEGSIASVGGSQSESVGLDKQAREFDDALEMLAKADAGELELAAPEIEALHAKIKAEIERISAIESKERAKVRRDAGKLSKKDAADRAEQTNAMAVKELDGTLAAEPASQTKTEKSDTPAEAAPDNRTDLEKARDAWDTVASEVPNAPLFADLEPDDQETFVDYGENNWTAEDVMAELGKYQKAGKYSDLQFGKAARAANPYTAKELQAELQSFMRAGTLGRRVTVVGDVSELQDLRDVVIGTTNESAFGWARNGNVVLIAGRIQRGTGRAKFMHEVGTHLGLENLLPQADYNRLTEQVVQWAKTDNGSVENRLATRAAARVQNAKTPKADQRAELLAYFVEEAVQAGIDPTALQDVRGPLRRWFDNLIQAFKTALLKLGMKPESLTAKDIVDLAYGAAKLELEADALQTEGDVKFGKNMAAPTESVIQRNIAKLPKQAQAPARNSVKSVQSWARKALDRAVFTADLIGRAEKAGVAAARQFADNISRRGTFARSMEREVEKIADMYADIPDTANGKQAINDFLFDATRKGKWPYDSGKHKADPDTRDAFEALDPAAQRFVRAVFDHGAKVLKAKKDTVLTFTTSEYDAAIQAAMDAKDNIKVGELKKEKAAELRRFETLFSVNESRPYAPIRRMGDFVVVAKSTEYLAAEEAGDKAKLAKMEQDPDHYRVSFKDTQFAANQLRDGYAAAGFTADAFRRSTAQEQFFRGTEAMMAMTKLQSMARDRAATGDKTAAAMQRMVSEMFLQTLADSSARKSEIRRRNIPGEVDMLQSFAVQGRADAQFVSGVRYNQVIQDSIRAMVSQAAKSGDRNRANEVVNELTDRYNTSLEYQAQPWLNKLTRMSSVYFLATSPAYYLQNLTQPWMMSLPAMAGRHNYATAATVLGKSYGELKDVMKSAKLFEQGWDFSKVPADVRDVIQELTNRGRIDIGLDTELGEFQIEEKGKASKLWNRIDKGMRLGVQKVEALNRLTTAITAYRLELTKTGSKEAALEYADRILSETHGDYGAFNAPKYFNTTLGKVALQFRKFQLIQLSFYAKLLRDAFTDPAERAAALKTLAYSLGHTGLLAGAIGMPGYAAIAWLLGALMGDEDEPYDLTYELRKLIGDEDVANLILRGAPTLAGVDLSGKVGAGNMLSIMPFSNADMSTPQGRSEALGTLVGGASMGVANRLFDGLGMALSGDWLRGLEYMLPKGLGDALKAARIQGEGMTRRNGDVILPSDEVSLVESIIQGIGFLPADQAVVYERRNRSYEMDNTMQNRSRQIKQQYAKAVKEGDADAKAEARQAWTKLQEARRRNGYTVQPLSELLKAPQEQSKRERNTVGGVQFNRNTQGFAQQNAAV